MVKNLPITGIYSFPNFPKFLPIVLILFTEHHQLFLFLFYCVNDDITMQLRVTMYNLHSLLYLLTALIDYLTVLLEYLDLFAI